MPLLEDVGYVPPTDRAVLDSVRPGRQRERMDSFLTIVTGGHADVDLIDDRWTATAELHRTLLAGTRAALTEEERELADFATMNGIRFSFGPGPIAFHDLLRTWRTDGSMEQVLWTD